MTVNRPISGWYLPMSEVPIMTPEQLNQARRLIPQKCCNYDKGFCLALDGDEPCQCVQMWSYSLICKWFHFAVLPNNWELCAQIHNNLPQKRCAVCGRPVYSIFHRTKYCPDCAIKMRKINETERLRRRYLKSRI